MAQKSWQISDPLNHSHYDIGMYHGDESNHLIIYIGDNPIIIDFHVNKTTSYSFMIGPYLYNLKIDKINLEKFNYHLELDDSFKKQLEEKRKAENQWDQIKLLAFACIVLIVLWLVRNS